MGAIRQRVLVNFPSNAVIQGNANMAEGTINKVMEKGFGFIATGEGNDIFFHHSAVSNRGFENLTEGQKVEYTVDNSPNPRGKGPRASTVLPM